LAKIAILPTSKPLRAEVVKHGKVKQVLNGKALGELAAKYDVVIIASTASDEFYQYLYNYLPLQQRPHFRLYGRSFFTGQEIPEDADGPTDQRTLGWMQILRENHINFDTLRKTMGEDLLPRMEQFNWQHMAEFIFDDRVDILNDRSFAH